MPKESFINRNFDLIAIFAGSLVFLTLFVTWLVFGQGLYVLAPGIHSNFVSILGGSCHHDQVESLLAQHGYLTLWDVRSMVGSK
ncbi:hypothetical protein EI16_11930 [Hydrogenovibrio marinus]|uniref:Uncharacterized protein n=1 Tax=Hydrogenovibrio marinus TaxID=28885 RepID=A0A066ZW83_HYDMR|nr:hypothetical protein EI16_11930 [Hydrogenovibrio marinus]